MLSNLQMEMLQDASNQAYRELEKAATTKQIESITWARALYRGLGDLILVVTNGDGSIMEVRKDQHNNEFLHRFILEYVLGSATALGLSLESRKPHFELRGYSRIQELADLLNGEEPSTYLHMHYSALRMVGERKLKGLMEMLNGVRRDSQSFLE